MNKQSHKISLFNGRHADSRKHAQCQFAVISKEHDPRGWKRLLNIYDA